MDSKKERGPKPPVHHEPPVTIPEKPLDERAAPEEEKTDEETKKPAKKPAKKPKAPRCSNALSNGKQCKKEAVLDGYCERCYALVMYGPEPGESEKHFWPAKKRLPKECNPLDFYERQPCPNCRRIHLPSGGQATVCQSRGRDEKGRKVAGYRCMRCGHEWVLPIRKEHN